MAKKESSVDLDDAYQAFDAGRFESALELAESALKAEPGDRDAWLLKATCMDAMGDTDGALQEYEALTEQFPDDAEVWVRLADLSHHGLGEPEMAVEALETALDAAMQDEENPDEEMAFEAHLRLVDALLELDALDEALDHADKARQLDRDSTDAETAHATVLFEMGRIDDAEKSVAKAIDKDAQNANAWYLRGMILERKKDAAGTKRAYDKARSLDEDAFPEPMKLTNDELLGIVKDVMEDLPPRVRGYLENVKIVVEELPADADLLHLGGALHPTDTVALRGRPLADEQPGEPFDHKPDALVLYRGNLARGAEDDDDLAEELHTGIALEVARFLDMDPADPVFGGFEE